MRRSLVTLLILATACTGSAEETTTSTTAPTTPASPGTSTPATTSATTGGTTSTTAATTTTTLPPMESLAYEEVASLEFPVHMVPFMDGSALVATKDGQVWLYDGSTVSESAILDISAQVHNEGERGLLGVAVHPDDPARVFVHYSGDGGDTVVSEFAWDGGSLGGEEVLFTHEQPAGNHNGGMIQLGPGGFLYLGLGDGGGGGDTFGNGQNTDTLLGGLVRLDVDDRDAEPVLWQYGLRNPWRFWIEDDLIYIADVGQNAFEEVNVSGLDEGVNYGWPITEATHCFSPSSGCDTDGLTLPVVEVEHGDAGTCSITGGIVYRGEAIPEIRGQYFYSDYCGGYLRSFTYQDGEVAGDTDWTEQVGVPGQVSSFGIDFSGEMYILTTDGIHKVVARR